MQSRAPISLLRLLTIIIPVIVLTGCFGGGDGPAAIAGAPRAPLVGVLVNSPIEGVDFATATQSGVTNADGEFRYYLGEMITFSIGAVISTVPAAPVITPVELTGSVDPGTDTMPNAATNLMILLQSIDADQNDANRITISAATRAAIQALDPSQIPDFNSPTFATDLVTMVDTVAQGNAVVTYRDALDNFCQSYLSLINTTNFGWSFTGCASPGGGGPVELLTNGDFETGDASMGFINGTPPGWSDSFNAVSVGSCLFDSCQQVPAPRSGDQVVKMFGPFATNGAAGTYQDVAAIPGESYTASAWANNSVADPLQGNNLADVQLFFLDASGAEIGGTFAAETTAGLGSLPQDTWVLLEATAVAPPGTVSARIQLLHIQLNSPATGGAIFFDDASLIGPSSSPPPPPPPTITELLTNGDFETGDASMGFINGTPPGWSDSFNAVSVGSCLFDSCQQVPAPRSGDQVVKMFGPFATNGAAGTYQDVAAIPGESYTASAWANNSVADPLQGNNLADVQLFFLDASGAEIGGTFAAETTADLGSLPQDTWVLLEATAVAPPGTVSARIQLLHIQLNSPATGGAIFFDDASLIGPPSGVPAGFQLVFWDEFNVDGPPDTIKWTAETGNGPPDNEVGFGNNEWQEYTTNPDNLRVEGGNLVIQARCEITPCVSERVSPGNGSITSAKIKTQDKFEFQYGIVRARIKASGGFAAWPAFWMLGFDYPTTPWPNAGEIDIMELFQNNSSPFETHSTIHFCNDLQSAPQACVFANGWEFITTSISALEQWSDDFHIYELEWTADRLIMRTDGIEVFNRVIDPNFMEEFQKDFYLILNLAMGGNLGPGGNQPPDPNRTFVETSLVDWVRVYQAVP